MKKLQVQSIDNNKYTLIDKDNNTYIFNLYFIDIDYSNITSISMSLELLNTDYYEYSDTYNFGPLCGVYGRKLSRKTIQDFIVLETANNKYYLQRYYG